MSVIITLTGNDFLVDPIAGYENRYRIPTLADLLIWLRIELNDTLENGNTAGTYTDEELRHFLNRAKAETELRTRCHRTQLAVSLTADTHTYDVSPIFELIEVSHNGVTLNLTTLEDMANLSQSWEGASAGTPTEVLQLSGSQLRLYPPPNEAAAALPLLVHGYATSEALVEAADTVDSIPAGYASDVLLEGAKAYAYKARASHPTSITLASESTAKFEALCHAIVQSRKAGAV